MSTSAHNVLAFQCLQPLVSDPSQGVNMRNWIWVQEPRWRSCKKCFFLELCQPLQVHKPWDQGSVWNALLAAEECLRVNGFKRKWGGKKVSHSFRSISEGRIHLGLHRNFCMFVHVLMCKKYNNDYGTSSAIEWQLIGRCSPTGWEKVCDKN